MSFALFAMAMLFGFSVVTPFVIHPSREEPAASADSTVSHHRHQDESLWSIRKSLLRALNMQMEPRLPAGGLDSVRQQWQKTFRAIPQSSQDTNSEWDPNGRPYAHSVGISPQLTPAKVHNVLLAAAASGYSVSPDSGNSTSLKCCSTASEIFMKDLGWDSWVIHPLSLTIVQCALCQSADDTVHHAPSVNSIQDGNSQAPCCQPTSQGTVPIVYMDETSTVVISDLQLTRSCGCGPGTTHQPDKE
ncbi:unnamed protein product [Menidia menidia]|uniref:(Atlantic silverside) hypothetical protein n=1 Tax=Menidia menidia TaxID=238744 RepID=A0A8S4AMQ0_9TELE|nr:unnamed protein product [Menidia menidia]CAG5893452.1 unnamed protein product [Menidia menidia]